MPFDYEANLDAVANALSNYNTTTANPDLSSGLTSRIKNVFKNDPEVASIKNLDLPSVYVRIASKDEDYESLGGTGPTGNRKRGSVTYDIIGLYMKDGAVDPHSTLLTETYRLAENIEGVFQAEYQLSNTALWCNPASTNFSPSFGYQGALVKGVLIQLRAEYFFR